MKIHPTWTVGIASELMDFGATMDGERFIAETYYVFISTMDGNFIHGARFDGSKQCLDEEGWVYYPDLRDIARAEAKALQDKIMDKGEIDPYFWDFRPHYATGGADLLWQDELIGA